MNHYILPYYYYHYHHYNNHIIITITQIKEYVRTAKNLPNIHRPATHS